MLNHSAYWYAYTAFDSRNLHLSSQMYQGTSWTWIYQVIVHYKTTLSYQTLQKVTTLLDKCKNTTSQVNWYKSLGQKSLEPFTLIIVPLTMNPKPL